MSGDNYSALPILLQQAMPKELGRNPKTLKTIYDATEPELAALESHLDCTATTLAASVAVVGKLIIHARQNEITDRDWNDIGDFMVTAGESLKAIRNMEESIRDAEPQPSQGKAA